MAWDKGFNFRQSADYVTDGANETYALNPSLDGYYPVTRNGVTFGWEVDPNGGINCNSGVDRRLAGVNYTQNNIGSQGIFRVDLPNSGTFSVRAAFADTRGNGWQDQYAEIRDDASVVHTLSNGDLTTTTAADIQGNLHAWADWGANNSPTTETFSTTTLRIAIGSPASGADYTVLSHLFISEQEAGGFQAAWARGANVLIGGFNA